MTPTDETKTSALKSHFDGAAESNNRTGKFTLGYRPGLDGLRGLAILLVLISHGFPRLGGSYGFVGVQVFFVLSGFLITSLLLEERASTGTIRLRAFYARRALRLLPAVMALLAVFVIYAAFTTDPYYRKSFFLEALGIQFYYANWGIIYEWFTAFPLGHAWSLAVEEQFYLIWPLLLVFLLRRCLRQTMLKILIICIFLSWLERYLLFSGTEATWSRIAYGTDTRGEPLLIGCALALMLESGMLPPGDQIKKFLARSSLISLCGLVLIAIVVPLDSALLVYFGWTLLALFTVVLIRTLLSRQDGWVRTLFESAAMVYLGRLSYSLYLWHNFVLQITHGFGLPRHQIIAINLAAIALCTLASYYLVERPFLRLKKRFQRLK